LRRAWFEGLHTQKLQSFVKQKVLEEIIDVKREVPGILLRQYEVAEVNLGDAPTFSNFSVVSKQTLESDFTVLFNISVKDIAFVAMIETTLDFCLGVKVELSELSGRMAFQYSPSHFHTLSFAFIEMPKVDIKVNAMVIDPKNTKLNNLISSVIVFAVNTVIRKKLTLPAMKTKYFINRPKQPPYPWEISRPEEMYDFVPEDPMKKKDDSKNAAPKAETSSDGVSSASTLSANANSASAAGQTSAPNSGNNQSSKDFEYAKGENNSFIRRVSKAVTGHTPNEKEGTPEHESRKMSAFGRFRRKDHSSHSTSTPNSTPNSTALPPVNSAPPTFSGSNSQGSSTSLNSISSANGHLGTRSQSQGSIQAHQWLITDFLKDSKCNICHEVMWGVMRQGVICTVCDLAAHEKCAAAYSLPCHREVLLHNSSSSSAPAILSTNSASYKTSLTSISENGHTIRSESSETLDVFSDAIQGN